MKKRQNRKKSGKIIISLFVFIIIIISVYFIYNRVLNDENNDEVKIIKIIDKYDYNLYENETLLYQEKFNELEKILSKKEIDYDSYAKKIAELFVIDFYTLNNKISKNDIGGVEFVIPSLKDNFIEQARSTFYRYIEVDSSRTQKLPEVSEITSVNVEKTSFKYKDKRVDEDAYKVSIKWDYQEDLDYEKEAKMILVKEDNKLYIVEMN